MAKVQTDLAMSVLLLASQAFAVSSFQNSHYSVSNDRL